MTMNMKMFPRGQKDFTKQQLESLVNKGFIITIKDNDTYIIKYDEITFEIARIDATLNFEEYCMTYSKSKYTLEILLKELDVDKDHLICLLNKGEELHLRLIDAID